MHQTPRSYATARNACVQVAAVVYPLLKYATSLGSQVRVNERVWAIRVWAMRVWAMRVWVMRVRVQRGTSLVRCAGGCAAPTPQSSAPARLL
jgi:hypothetical protein